MATITLPTNFAEQAWNEPFTLTVQCASREVYDLFVKAVANQAVSSSSSLLRERVGLVVAVGAMIVGALGLGFVEQLGEDKARKVAAAGTGMLGLSMFLRCWR